ncbi:MAG: hypothetical protein IPF54_13210 [Draconibacterium sp.]|nr:hypothetical protein [Draconibacterium sp.]
MVDGISQGAVSSYTFSNVAANHTISATFIQGAYTITASAGANGSITPSGAVSVTSGSSQPFTIAANPCYQIATVLIDGVNEPAAVASGTYTFTNVSAAHTISATFTPITYSITSSAGANGSISPAGSTIVNCGANQSFTITPSLGYQVEDVLVDGSSVGALTTYEFTNVTSNHTISASFEIISTSLLGLDGTISSGTGAPTASSVSFSHTTGTGTNRLMMVGISWNCGTTNRTISAITFTPNGGSSINLTEVRTQQYTWTTNNYRYAAIYSLLNPGSGITGTVNVTFSGAVSNGIIAGAANFAGVNQTTPLGTSGGAVGTGTSTSGTPNPAVSLSGLNGNELVFDCVFMGTNSTSQTMTADAGQSELYNILGYSSSSTSFNTRGAASIKQVTGTSATMSWTTDGYGTTATRWAIAAVPINPTVVGPTHTLVWQQILLKEVLLLLQLEDHILIRKMK